MINFIVDESPRHTLSVLLYMAKSWPPPASWHAMADPKRYSTQGITDATGIPPAATYRAVNWLAAGNFIAPYEEPLRISSNRPTRVYHLTHRGHGYLDAYMRFKQAVEGL